MRKISISVFFIVLLFHSSVAQSDCHCKQITDQQTDELINENDSVAIYQLINKLKKDGDKICSIISYNIEVSYLIQNKKNAAALSAIQEQEKLITAHPCKKELISNTYLNYATHSKMSQNYEALSDYAFKLLATVESGKNKEMELKAIAFIVLLNTRQKQYEKHWDYIKRAEKIILENKEDYSTAANFNWLAFEYEALYSRHERKSLLDSALLFTKKALAVAVKSNNHYEIIRSYRIFESNAANNEDYLSAIQYADSALLYFKKLKVPANPAPIYITKAMDYVELKNYAEAVRWIDSSIYYSEKNEGRGPATLAVYQQAALVYEESGNLPRTVATMKIYNKIKDSVFKQERLERINELEQKYNKAKNEKTITELAQQKRIYLLLALAALFAVAAIGFFLRQQSLKHKKNILETEQRLNRARMNPHFFFNALSALQKFALKENNGQAMASNLSRFSHIMRETLESTYKEYVTIEQEMDFLNEYLEVQKIRFPETFSYTVTAAGDVETDELQIPAMIIQPFVENSIEHGFAGVDYPGKVSIHFAKQNNGLQVTIADNGKGLINGPRESTAGTGNEHISRASQIIKDRIYLLNIKLKSKAGFSIDNNPEGPGVRVQINLPLIFRDEKTNEQP